MKPGMADIADSGSDPAGQAAPGTSRSDEGSEMSAADAPGAAAAVTGPAAADVPKPNLGAGRALWRRVKGVTRTWRLAVIAHTPAWARRMFGPVVWYFDMLLIDHGVFRLFYVNRHRLGDKAWRSAQPAPHHIRALKRRGLRTIVNLRGARLCGSYWLEEAVCARKGIKLMNFQIRSRAAPTPSEIKAARDLFDRIEYPMLMHCKSGADRVGLMSALYRFLKEGVPIEEARHELSLRYGHFRQADTGVLDRFFEKYLEDNRRQPIEFFEWVDTVYDPDELKREFRAAGWARRLVDQILKRE
jgi:protein tyrosine/serine phosphatase